MRLKYYLRGLGIGIMITTIVLAVSFAKHGKTMSDAEIIARAKELGMVMQDEASGQDQKNQENGNKSDDLDQNQQNNVGNAGGDAGSDAGTDNPDSPNSGGDGQQLPPADGDQGQQPDVTQFEFVVERGDSSNMVSQRLAQMGLIDDADAFNRYMTENNYDSRMLPGTIMIPEGATYEQIANLLVDKELQR